MPSDTVAVQSPPAVAVTVSIETSGSEPPGVVEEPPPGARVAPVGLSIVVVYGASAPETGTTTGTSVAPGGSVTCPVATGAPSCPLSFQSAPTACVAGCEVVAWKWTDQSPSCDCFN